MNTRPEALGLADEFVRKLYLSNHEDGFVFLTRELVADAAAELRRLHEENEALREANEAFGRRQEWWDNRMGELEDKIEAKDALLRQAREALEKTQRYGLNAATFQTITAIRQHLGETE